MAFNYRLPQITADSVTILNTPTAATDVVLASGGLTVKDEGGNPSLVVRANDLLSFTYAANNAGTANARSIVLTLVPLNANTTYVLTVHVPYLINFFGGGQETGAIYQTRTYTIGFGDGTATPPTVDGIGNAFANAINADNNAAFSATYTNATDTLLITADSAFGGPLEITAPLGSTNTNTTPWVSPVGSNAEVVGYAGNNPYATAAAYRRYIVRYRKMVRHSAVTGLQVIKPVNALVYLDNSNGGTAATVTKLTSILDGSYATTADYLGCPAV
jgi:hypothetical protein